MDTKLNTILNGDYLTLKLMTWDQWNLILNEEKASTEEQWTVIHYH
jgi:hypothetical protein